MNNILLKEYLDLSEFVRPVSGIQAPQQNMLLVGGDFSGIQKYIYKIASKHAGRSLKGRSFYLHLLSDAIVRLILKELNLQQDSVVYNSGGSFYLVAPNTEQVKKTIDETAYNIEKSLFTAHETDLYLALAYEPLTADALSHRNGADLRKTWTDLFLSRNKQKKRKFSRLLVKEPETFFSPFMRGGECTRDSITGEELDDRIKPDKDGLALSPISWAQIEIGKALQTCNRMLVTELPINAWNELPHVSPANLGFTYYFVQEKELSLWQAKAPNVHAELVKLKGSAKWVRSFEELSEGTRLERLGVLRMDVDNLGTLFQSGIPAESATLERYRQLSHKFDYFFSDYLYDIQQEVAPDSSLVIYSGGDDLFIVGAWDSTIQLAKRIRDDFRIYTKHNPRFSISGGIAIVENKFPIMKGAELSAHEEHLAKTHKVHIADGIQDKNSLSFLGVPLNWDAEFPAVEQLKEDMLGMLKTQDLNKSFLGKVMKYAAAAHIRDHKITNYKVFWMIPYDLSRMRSECKNAEVVKLMNRCIKEVCQGGQTLNGVLLQTDYHPLELWCFACRWAELEYRTRY